MSGIIPVLFMLSGKSNKKQGVLFNMKRKLFSKMIYFTYQELFRIRLFFKICNKS